VVKSHKSQPHKKVLKQEKEVLEKISSPLIMSMFKAFEDSNYYLFLLEYVQGLELFEVLRQEEME
jgi:cGMP-dependent protein kinase